MAFRPILANGLVLSAKRYLDMRIFKRYSSLIDKSKKNILIAMTCRLPEVAALDRSNHLIQITFMTIMVTSSSWGGAPRNIETSRSTASMIAWGASDRLA